MGHAERLNPHARKTEVTLPPDTMDRLGRVLGEGDLVTVPPPADALWEVEAVRPNLDPKEPPNVVELQLVTRYRIRVPAHRVIPQVLLVRAAEKTGPKIVEFVPPGLPVTPPWWKRMLGLGARG